MANPDLEPGALAKPLRGAYTLARRTQEAEHKTCTACGAAKPSDAFYFRRDRRRLMAMCIVCFQSRASRHQRLCSWCGSAFTGRVHTLLCSEACRAASLSAQVVERRAKVLGTWKCRHCGGPPNPNVKLTAAAERQYCSKACEGNARKRPKPQRLPRLTAKKATVCKACGGIFLRFPSLRSKKYCSRKCYKAVNGQRPLFIKAKCHRCGQEFRRTTAALKRTKRNFCSKECSRLSNSGEGSYAYRGGHDPNRGPLWQRLAESIRVRDGHRCQRCNTTQAENRQKLSVDHIVPWREFEDKVAANDPANLVALCRRCHSIKTNLERLWLKGDRIGMDQYRLAIQLPPLLAWVPDSSQALLPKRGVGVESKIGISEVRGL